MSTPLGRAALFALLASAPAIAWAQPPEAVRVAVLDHPIARGDVPALAVFTEDHCPAALARLALPPRSLSWLPFLLTI